MECCICSCTELDPCVDQDTGETCGWAPPLDNPQTFREALPICTFCAALRDIVREAKEPLVELATEGDLQQLIREMEDD